MPTKVALITGATGQDGADLAELLLGKGYIVRGVKRRSSSFNTGRVDHYYVDPHEDHRGTAIRAEAHLAVSLSVRKPGVRQA